MHRVKELKFWPDGKEVHVRQVRDVAEELQMGEGRTNQNFIVDVEGSKTFVRIGGDLPFFGVSRQREHAASRAAQAAGVAPVVQYTELPDAMVLELVPGRALTADDMHSAASGSNDALLQAIVKSIRRLHESEVPPELNKFLEEVGPVGWGGPHLAKWLEYAESRSYSRLPLLDGLRPFIAKLEAVAGPLGSQKFCHFDLLADNLVLSNNGDIVLVDFEYAAPGEPLMDLAVLAMGCSLTADEKRTLLAAYLQRDSEADFIRFKALSVLAALRETFWGVTAELSQSSALSLEDARSYADMNYGKYVALREEFERAS